MVSNGNNLEERLGFVRESAPLSFGTVKFENATRSVKKGFEFNPDAPRAVVTGTTELPDIVSRMRIWDDEKSSAFEFGYHFTKLGGQIIVKYANANSIAHSAAVGAARAAEDGYLPPIAVNKGSGLFKDPELSEIYGAILHLDINSGIGQLDSMVRNSVLSQAATIPVAYSGKRDANDILTTWMEMHSEKKPAMHMFAEGTTRLWMEIISRYIGGDIIVEHDGEELAKSVMEEVMFHNGEINSRMSYFNKAMTENSFKNINGSFDHSYARKIGFVTKHIPLRIGNINFVGLSVSYRPGIRVNADYPIVFFAGGAGDYYDMDNAFDMQSERKNMLKAGSYAATNPFIAISGFCPHNSFPHQAMVGAYNSGNTVIGINPKGTIPDSEEYLAVPKVYHAILHTGINTGDPFSDFVIRNFFNIMTADVQVMAGGNFGTFDEGNSRALFEPKIPIAVLPNSGGMTPVWSEAYQIYSGLQIIQRETPEKTMRELLKSCQPGVTERNGDRGMLFDILRRSSVQIFGGGYR